VIISAARKDLMEAINRASQGIPGKPLNPVYAGMLIRTLEERIQLVASDGDVTFTSTAPADIRSPGAVVLPGKMLTEVSRYFTGDSIGIECPGDSPYAELVLPRSRFRLHATPAEKYPDWAQPPYPIGEVPAEEFASILKKVAKAADSSGNTPALETVNLSMLQDRLFAVSTDRYRMGLASLDFLSKSLRADVIPPDPALVPRGVAERFARVLEDGVVSLGWNESLISMQALSFGVISRLISGKFLPWQSMLKEPEGWFTADTEELIRSIRMAALVAADDKVTLDFAKDELTVSAATGTGEASSTLGTSGWDCDPVSLLFGAQMLLDGLSGCDSVTRMALLPAGGSRPQPLLMESGNYRWLSQSRRELKEG
jgi:DNA polymerase-3 subunit beta